MTYTKGPWAVNPYCAQVDCTQMDEDGDLFPVCQMLWPTELRSERETEANAHLIAAAPDLLEALERILRYQESGGHDGDCEDVEEYARAAIAKARGHGS